jgi:hypothetical protein
MTTSLSAIKSDGRVDQAEAAFTPDQLSAARPRP